MRGGDRVSRGKRRHRGPHLYKRGERWWLYVDHATRVSLGTTDEAAARERLPDALRRARDAQAAGPRPGAEPTLVDLAAAYLQAHTWSRQTRRTYGLRLGAFAKAMAGYGVQHASGITTAVLARWRSDRVGEVGRATINRDETVPSRMLAWAASCTPPLIAASPMASHKPVKAPRRAPPPIIPSPAEVGKVVAVLHRSEETGAALAVATALATGLRIDELRHLRPEHVHGDALHLEPETGPAAEAWEGKSHSTRVVPLAPAAAAVARQFAVWRTTATHGRGRRPGISGTWLAARIDAACSVAGVESFRAHDLRRTFATENVRAGVPITVVRGWLSHRDVATTERYLGRYRSDVDRVAATAPALATALRSLTRTVRKTVRSRSVQRPNPADRGRGGRVGDAEKTR